MAIGSVEVVTHCGLTAEQIAIVCGWAWNDYWAYMLDDSDADNLNKLTATWTGIVTQPGNMSYGLSDENGALCGAVWIERTVSAVGIGHFCFSKAATHIKQSERLQFVQQCIGRAFESGLRKISWTFYPANRAYECFLRRLGAIKEGVLMQHALQGGKPTNIVLMASFPC